MPARAFLFTWTTYGSWLHGDDRSSVDGEHNRFRSERIVPNRALVMAEQALLKHEAVRLSREMRLVVRDAIMEHCLEKRYPPLAINVRTNHVHAVVACGVVEPRRTAGGFKAWATRKLRETRCVDGASKVWTEGASVRYLWTSESVHAAISYVLNEQGPRDEFASDGEEVRRAIRGAEGKSSARGLT